MFLSAYKKEAMNISHKEKSSYENFTPIKIINKTNKKENALNENKDNSEALKKKTINGSNFSLDKFENKTKKGIKFGLLEYKRINEIKNFDIYNGKILINLF